MKGTFIELQRKARTKDLIYTSLLCHLCCSNEALSFRKFTASFIIHIRRSIPEINASL